MSRVLTREENIGTAAARHRGLRELFEELGLDYWCEGDLSISEAVSGAGLDIRSVRSRMERRSSADAGPNWLDEPLSALVGHLDSVDHGIVRASMFRVALLFGDVCREGGAAAFEIMRTTFRELSSDLIMHMEHEEHTIFPAIVAMEEAWNKREEPPPRFEGGFRAAAARYVREHARLSMQLRALRRERLDAGHLSAAAQRLFAELDLLERTLHEGMNLENYVAFPRAIALEDALTTHLAPELVPA
jgi:iron-sulfur cluster repair protein YtfE (RIC family)